MSEQYFELDGHSSLEWGVHISGDGVWNSPARRGEQIAIPGKNGDIWQDGGAYENITVTYPCWIAEGFEDRIDDFRAFLLTHADKYYLLRDTYHFYDVALLTKKTDRRARFSGMFTAEPGTRNLTGRFDVTFDCHPFLFNLVQHHQTRGTRPSDRFSATYNNETATPLYFSYNLRANSKVTFTNGDYAAECTLIGNRDLWLHTDDMILSTDAFSKTDEVFESGFSFNRPICFPPGRTEIVEDLLTSEDTIGCVYWLQGYQL